MYNPYSYSNYQVNYLNELKNRKDMADMQYQQYQQMLMQNQQPAINQTFQITNPTQATDLITKNANSIDEVKNTFITQDTIFLNKENTYMWQKDTNGNIRTYALAEIVELDEKDRKIIELEKELKELKEGLANGGYTKYNESNERGAKSSANDNVDNDTTAKTNSKYDV